MRALFCGSRWFTDAALVRRVLARLAPDDWIVLHGAAPGADTLVEQAAGFLGLRTWPFPAAWGRYGISAGPLRNREMLAVGRPDVVIVFPGGDGTKNMVLDAAMAGVWVVQASRFLEMSMSDVVGSIHGREG